MGPLVVKLGGSHARSGFLRPWLRVIADANGAALLVPGGGPFADTVRETQRAMGFDERAAHEMALLAMAQFGRALVALQPRLVLAASVEAIRARWASGQIPVWSPWPMALDAADIPASWDVTSDSLALWLARLVDAPRLLLVKHRAPPAGAGSALLVADGLVDRAFPRFLSAYRGEVWLAGPADLPPAGLNPAAPPGQKLAP